MLFTGVLAAAFYTLVLGAVWPPRAGATAVEALIGQIGKSLFLSWFVVVVSYWLDLPDLLLPLLCVVALSLIWQAAFRRRAISGPFLLAVSTVGTVLPCAALVFGGFGSDYRLIYMTGDAVLSWNGWAVELTANQYHPIFGGPYPLLFPGLWSLIYKAQGTPEVWIIGKLTLLVVPALLVLLVFLMIDRQRYIHAALLGAFVAQFFFLSHAFPMLLGDMDIPVCAMMLVVGVFIYLAATDFAEGRREDGRAMTLLAAIFVGLASVTKQWGIVVAVPLLLLVAAAVVRAHLKWQVGLLALGLSILPALAFFSIYLPLQTHPFGIIGNLIRTSELASPGGDTLAAARGYILGMLPKPAFIAIGVLSLGNLFNLRRLAGWLGVVFLALATGAFFFYAKCCTYDQRNGWSIIILFALAAFFGADPIRRLVGRSAVEDNQSYRFPAAVLPVALLLIAIAGAAAANWQFSDRHVRAVQEREQWKLSGYQFGHLIRVNLDRFRPGDILLFGFDLVGWLPTMKDHLCTERKDLCIDKASAGGHRFFVIVGPGYTPDPRLQPYLTLRNLIGDADGRQLYGPIDLSARQGPAEPSVIEAAASGAQLSLHFDKDVCEPMNLSGFDCAGTYSVQYDPSKNAWLVKGPVKGSDTEVSDAYSNAPDRPGNISIWGMAGIFDRWGSLIVDGVKLGTLSPAAS